MVDRERNWKNYFFLAVGIFSIHAKYQPIVDEEKKRKAKIVKAVNDALKSTETCLEKEPDNGNCHKWKAILLLNQEDVDYKQVSEDVSLHIVRYHLEKSVEINPSDPKILTYLGLWYKEAYYMDRQKAWEEKSFFQKVKPDFKNLEKAIEYFKMAESIEPNYLISINLKACGKARSYAPGRASYAMVSMKQNYGKNLEKLSIVAKIDWNAPEVEVAETRQRKIINYAT